MENHNHGMPFHGLNCDCSECCSNIYLCEECLVKDERIQSLEQEVTRLREENNKLKSSK